MSLNSKKGVMWDTLLSSFHFKEFFSRFFVCTPPGKKGLGRMDGVSGGEAAEEAGEEGGGEGEQEEEEGDEEDEER